MFSRRRRFPRVGLLAALLPLWATPLSCTASEAPADVEGDPATGPARLSETGLYAELTSRTLAPGVIPYAPAHPLWSDGSDKRRYLLLPEGAKIDTRDMDRWVFPVGTKAWKEFWVGGRLVETRLLWKRRPEPGIESWWRVAYVWNQDGSDAVASVEGVPSAAGTAHDVPKQEDCTYCHLYVRDGVIGFSALELSSLGAVGNAPGSLSSLSQRGIFTDPPAADFAVPGSGLVKDALGYLHGNCGFCHNERMEQLISRRIRFRLLTSDTAPEQTGAYTTTFHTKMRHIMADGVDEAIVPGEPDRSQAYRRMTATDLTRMPPRGTKLVDDAGSALIRDWILGLPRQ